MNRMFSIASVLALSLGVLFSVSAGVSILYGQQNQTSNMTSTQQQQNQTGIGSASEIENLTTGNIPALGNATDIESQNDTSLAQGLQREKMTTDTNMTTNQTGEGGMTNGTTTNQTGAEGEQQQGNQTEKGPIEQLGETISGMFGGGNQSN
jgi:hypothetical protein